MASPISDEVTRALKRILRDCRSQSYFDGQGWTTDPMSARVFHDEIEAVRACVEHDLADVELVLRFEVDGVDVFSTKVR